MSPPQRAGMGSPLSTARGTSARLVGWIGLCALGRGGAKLQLGIYLLLVCGSAGFTPSTKAELPK